MSFSAGLRNSVHPYVFCTLLLACFVVISFVYYNSLSFDENTEGRKSCYAVPCSTKMNSNSNCSSKLHHNDTQKPQVAAENTDHDTIVLMWNKIPSVKFYSDCSRFNIPGCHLTENRSLFDKAHGVVLHHWDFELGRSHPKDPRPWFQKWVWLNVESPSFSGAIGWLNNLFNLTCNYRLDSNIPIPYGYLEPVTPEDESFKLPTKNKLVCWIVSHWSPSFKRVQYYNQLKQYINISTFGKGFKKPIGKEDYPKIVSSCKFYLSFENSVHKDYITEKLYNAMGLGSVPIVLGPSRQNYEEQIPGDSFIHIDDFSTPKELAEKLLYLDLNNTEYMEYFNWRKRFKAITTVFRTEYACKVCNYLQQHREYQAVHNLNKWYWS